ncbi:MAG: class I SAM-dependent RNA methyltransferase [Cyclobacteriaceae bacterium]|nr:class I SAM-dependent RNA methyltransferase [Cyclobacteriaceae bacterium]
MVKKEIIDLGYPVMAQDKLHVETEGTLQDTIHLNLYLRTAHRVLFFLDQFDAGSLNDLYAAIKKISWEEIIPLKGYFSIHSFVRQDNINDFRIVNLKMKDAIADRFSAKYQKRPDSGNQHDHLVLFIRWVSNHCEIYIDTSGETLAKHGYREHSWKAPLAESLAASIIYSMQWDHADRFINPMCGSGTLAIEAALVASGRYPGLYRDNYSFKHLKEPVDETYMTLKKKIQDEVDRDCRVHIHASDIHPGAVRQAMMNAQKAGVEGLIAFETRDFKDIAIPSPPGILIMNPGYGLRLGEEEKLEPLYESIGNFFKQKCNGYTGYVFTGNTNLGKQIGLRTRRKIPFLNGNIECRLLEYELYSGTKKIRPQ